ncbi:MAG: hypothetical protein ACTS43_02480 [Candidatus Hodgkinia cicadicola]
MGNVLPFVSNLISLSAEEVNMFRSFAKLNFYQTFAMDEWPPRAPCLKLSTTWSGARRNNVALRAVSPPFRFVPLNKFNFALILWNLLPTSFVLVNIDERSSTRRG